jgi:protein ImuB
VDGRCSRWLVTLAVPVVVTAVRTLVVHVADWPVVAAGAKPWERAAVVFANRVVACTEAARDEGVEVGMRRREAQSRCPALALLDHDPARDARAFEPVVATLADRLTPRVEVVAPGHAALPTRGPSRYFGGDEALAGLAVELVGAVLADRASPQVGIADGPFAALHAALLMTGDRPPLVVAPLGSPAFLAPRPVGTLRRAGVPDELLDVFGRLGLRTLGAVATLAAGDVAGRFGSGGVAAHRLASGRDERPPAPTPPPPDLAARLELDPPVERVETAAFLARGLADELAGRLAQDGLACARLLVAAETEHGERLERLWRGDGSGGASALTAGAIADRVRWQLDGWLDGSSSHRPTAGISLLELVPDDVVAATGRQLGFWGGATGADERAVRAVARVAGLLGPDAVLVPEWRGGRSPAEQVALVPAVAVDLGEERSVGVAPTPGREVVPWPGSLPTPAPATVAAPAAAAPVPTVDVRSADGGPVRVSGRGDLSAEPAQVDGRVVVAWAGPWPVEERWWDPVRHRRRARMQVITDDGVARLLTVEAGRWTVEAIYD